MKTARAVLDASVFVRATAPPIHSSAVEWLTRVHQRRVRAWAPDLMYAETAQALRNYVQVSEMTPSEAGAALAYILQLPVRLRALRQLAPAALELALASGLSVYDASYVVLAGALDATLVTADRRLAEHHDRVVLVA